MIKKKRVKGKNFHQRWLDKEEKRNAETPKR